MKSRRQFPDYLPYIMFILTVGISVVIYVHMVRQLKIEISNSLDMETREAAIAIKDRMGAYEQVLRGVEALLRANGYSVARDKWMEYASGLRINEKYPGIQAIGFASYVTPDNLAAHVRAMRAQGETDYEIRPKGKRDYYVVVNLMYPENIINRKVLGYDLASEPVRSAMLSRAAKTGQTGISGKMILKQDMGSSAEAGVLMAIPVRRNGRLIGYVSAPFRVKDLIHGVLKNNEDGITMKLYDSSVSDRNLMYSSGSKNRVNGKFTKLHTINFYGTSWIIEAEAEKGFFRHFDMDKPLLILFGGIITGVMFSLMIFFMLRTRTRAYEIAERMAQRYANSESRYKLIFEQAGVGIIMVSIDLRIFRVNKRFCDISGFSCKELKKKYYGELLQCSGQPTADMMLNRIKNNGGSYETERVILKKDGSKCIVNVTASVFKDHSGSPLYFILIADDITSKKETEDALIALSLRQTAILDNSLVGIIQIRNLKMEWVNRTFEVMSGYSAEELIGHTTELFHLTHESYDDSVSSFMDKEVVGIEGFVLSKLKARTKAGKIIWVEISAKYMGEPIESPAILVIRDITDKIEAEDALMKLNASLESKVAEETQKRVEQERLFMQQGRLAAMGEMIGAIAHQWRQPLNIIAIMVQNHEEDFDDGILTSRMVSAFCSKVMEQVEYMSSTIDDFRDFFSTDKTPVIFRPVEQIESVVKMASAQYKHYGISVSFDKGCKCCLVGLPNEFSHVILNIMNNSKDAFMARKTAAPTIAIKLGCNSNILRIDIEDNAGGVEESIKDKIFDPYFTTKGPDKGTGIGLYMSKQIIRDHFNGKLYLNNTDKGADFVIEIPVNVSDCGEKH